MNYHSDLPHRKALNSMREAVALMLERNGITEPSSMHHRCGMFLDATQDAIAALKTLPIEARMQFRVGQEAKDIELARAFRKLWEACQMIEHYTDLGRPPQEHAMAANLYGDNRI
jgi:hypothetical protein